MSGVSAERVLGVGVEVVVEQPVQIVRVVWHILTYWILWGGG